MTDAMNAADRFASAGRSQANVKPTTSLFLGDAAKRVMKETKEGTLVSAAQQTAAAAVAAVSAAAEEALDGLGGCTTALHCNREFAKQGRGEMDIKGTVAIVCSHVFPGVGCCLPMTVPECHHFYDLVLDYLLRTRPDTRDVYLDLMCRYANRFKGLIDRLSSQGIFPTSSPDISMLLPMMHAFDHNLPCQLQFSALYAPGVGRRVGEQTEVLWSTVKPFFKIARYMTFAHWWDNYNCLLWLLSLRKQERLPVMLESRIKRINEKKGEIFVSFLLTLQSLATFPSGNLSLLLFMVPLLTLFLPHCPPFTVAFMSDILKLHSEAALHGVHDLEAALQSMESSNSTTAASLSLAAKYVEVLLIVDSLKSMADHKAVYPLLMPRNTGIHLHGAAIDDVSKVKYRRLLAKYQTELNLPFGENWAETRLEYKDALKELCEHYTKHYAREIENEVFKRKLVEKELSHSEGSNNASKNRKRLEASKSIIRGLLDCYHTWEVKGTETARNAMTEERLRQVCGGLFPWSSTSVGANGSPSAQKHFAQRYHTAKNQLQRTVEEVGMLKKEVVRVFNWCEERVKEVTEKIKLFESRIKEMKEANDEDNIPAKDAAIIRRIICIMEGKKHVHMMEELRLKCIHGEARQRLRT